MAFLYLRKSRGVSLSVLPFCFTCLQQMAVWVFIQIHLDCCVWNAQVLIRLYVYILYANIFPSENLSSHVS